MKRLYSSLGLILIGLPICWLLQNVNWQELIYPKLKTELDTSASTINNLHRIMTSQSFSNDSAWWSVNLSTVDPRSIEYCRPRDHIVEGHEGEVSTSYKLLNVHTIIRHGERTTLYDLPKVKNPHVSCQFEKYDTEPSISSQYLEWVRNIELGSHSKYPTDGICKTGQLTPRGLTQQIYNGRYLGQVYGKLLFNSENNQIVDSTKEKPKISQDMHSMLDRIYIRTTDYSRTFQSALGFTYGLTHELPNKNIHFKLVRGSSASNICSAELAQESCVCWSLKTDGINKLVDDNHDDNLDKEKKAEVHQIKGDLGDVLGLPIGKVPWLGLSLEVFMGYVCQGNPLPCIQETGKCVTNQLLQNIWAATETNTEYKFIGAKERLKSTLEVYPLLKEIALRLLNVTRNVPTPKFVLYSGHDKTLTPLTIALGIYDGKWPSYASRLVMELYSRDFHYFIRVLYNGNDLTASLRFCDQLVDGLCSLGKFLKFIFSGFNHYGNMTYRQMCRL